MKRFRNKAVRIISPLTMFFCSLFLFGCEATTSTPEMFEQAWSDFDQNYSYFNYKNIDWNAVKTQYTPDFQENLSSNDFANQLGEMLQVLHDWHVYVTAPDGEVYGFNEDFTTNYPGTPRNRYATRGYQTLGDNVIWHGMIDENGENIAHIRVDTLSEDSFNQIDTNDIESLFQTYAGASGMIIDIRPNSGGNEENAAMISSHLISEGFTYGYTVERNGPNHSDFNDPEEHSLEPASGTIFTGPAVCLIGKRCMSSAEWFTLMMKRAPNVTLIGDTTRGASGFPKTFTLPNRVSYSICRWVAYTYEDKVIEDNGIAPDIAISAEESLDGEHDYVLERAIQFIESGETAPTTTTIPGGSTTTTVPSGVTSTTTTADASSTTTTATGSESPVIDSFSVSPTSGSFDEEFEFTCQAHAREGGYITYYYWDFNGDGLVDDFTSYGFYFLYGYFLETGPNIVQVQVQDDIGNYSDIASVTVTVEE